MPAPDHAGNLQKRPDLVPLDNQFLKIISGLSPLMMAAHKKYGQADGEFRELKANAKSSEEEQEIREANPELHRSFIILETIMHSCKAMVDYYKLAVDSAVYLGRPISSVAEAIIENAEISKAELEDLRREYGADVQSGLLVCDQMCEMANGYIDAKSSSKAR